MVVPFIIIMVFIFGTHQFTADPLRNKAAKTIFTLLSSNWDGLAAKHRINWVRNLSYLFRSLMNSLRRLIFNMGSWEIDAGARIRTGSTPVRAVTIIIMAIMAGDKGKPKGLR